MAAKKIRTNTDSLKKTNDEILQEIKAIEDAIEKIKADMATLNASWSGQARDAYVKDVQTDFDALDKIVKSLRKVTKYEKKAIDEYTKCENSVAGLISQIHI